MKNYNLQRPYTHEGNMETPRNVVATHTVQRREIRRTRTPVHLISFEGPLLYVASKIKTLKKQHIKYLLLLKCVQSLDM